MGFFGGEDTQTSYGWSQTTFGRMDPRLEQALGYTNWSAEQAARELGYGRLGGGGMPEGLSLEALSANPIVQMFGSVEGFKEFLANPELTPDQRKNLEVAFMAPYEALGARQEAAASGARDRLRMTADEIVAASREGRGASGIRGTTAGSANLARALASLGGGQAQFEREMLAEREATGRQAAGGLAGALVDMPFRNQQSMLAGLDALLSERAGRLQVRALSEDMRRTIMNNPAISALMSERLASGRTESYQKTTTPSPGWGAQLLGLGVSALTGGLGGGGGGTAAPLYQQYAQPAGPAGPANYYAGWPMNPYWQGG